MTDSHRTQNAVFNDLISRLHETVIQLAHQYEKDVEVAANQNKSLRLTLGDKSAGNNAKGQIGGKAPPLEMPALSRETSASDVVLKEVTASTSQRNSFGGTISDIEGGPPAKDIEGDLIGNLGRQQSSQQSSGLSSWASRSTLELPSKIGARGQHFSMRSPWIDQREFDNVALQDVMPEEMFASCILGTVTLISPLFEESIFVQTRSVARSLSRCVVHPQSRVRGLWLVASMAILLYDLIMVPIDACFDLKVTKPTRAIHVMATTFWTMDIVFTFFVGVPQVRTVEMDPSKIAMTYLKSWLIFDMLIIIPEWITLAIVDLDSRGQVSLFRLARWGRLTRLLRMVRILRSGRMKPLTRHLIFVLNLSKVYLQLLQALAGLSFALPAILHIISCLWYAIGNSSDDGWVSVNGLKSASVGRAYAAAFHWSFSRLHGMQAYMEMESVTEFILDALLIYVSLILAAYYTGTLAAVAMTSANSQSLNLWKLSIIFVKRHGISSDLEMKMDKFLECSAGGALEAATEELTLLEALPKALQQDLLFEARMPFLSNKPFLKDLLAANSRVVHQISNEAICQKVCVDGDPAFANGDACRGMLFVTSGVLFYITSERQCTIIRESVYKSTPFSTVSTLEALSMGLMISESKPQVLQANSSASEPVLWTQWTHTGTLLSIEESTSLVLSPLDFSQVLANHREAFCYALKYAKRFLWKLNHTHDNVDDLTVFHEITIKDLDTDMFEGTGYDHFIFLSHYKVEAGTEATLMRDLFQEILREDPNHAANNLRSPIFVDSEDLTDLSKLKEHVIGSASLVLLLTPGVLSRPWCLVEIVTAVDHNVNIVPVDIQRPGSKYKYPDDQFYTNILDGKFLNQAAVDLLESEGISLLDVERAIRKVFLKIALPFSPHKTKGIREAELHDILDRSHNLGQDSFDTPEHKISDQTTKGKREKSNKRSVPMQRSR